MRKKLIYFSCRFFLCFIALCFKILETPNQRRKIMGLDMYLSRKIYIGANHDFNKVKGTIKITREGYDRENETVIENEPVKQQRKLSQFQNVPF